MTPSTVSVDDVHNFRIAPEGPGYLQDDGSSEIRNADMQNIQRVM